MPFAFEPAQLLDVARQRRPARKSVLPRDDRLRVGQAEAGGVRQQPSFSSPGRWSMNARAADVSPSFNCSRSVFA
jgi:hypothetical protein